MGTCSCGKGTNNCIIHSLRIMGAMFFNHKHDTLCAFKVR